jgi:Flp pilus assembly pilin Flp
VDSGQDLAEYALLLGLIALVIFMTIVVLGDSIKYFFDVLGEAIASWGST